MSNETKQTVIVNDVESGVKVVDGPLTTVAVREGSPSLLLNEIDSRVVKVRPMATPIDQISRMVGARPASSMVVEYYSVDCKAPETSLTAPITKIANGDYSGYQTYSLKAKNSDVLAVTETLLMPTITGKDGSPLVLYVVDADKGTDSSLTVICLNPKDSDANAATLGKSGDKLVRMGRAAGELDVQTPQFDALPVKSKNFCQIFKAQVEQSTIAKLS